VPGIQGRDERNEASSKAASSTFSSKKKTLEKKRDFPNQPEPAIPNPD
jgi:hypothetical protein